MVWLFFFFFKQKTAYEMRISDWSSDVCSSDLKQIYLPLQNYSKQLKKYLESIKLPSHVRSLVRDILDRGLPDLAITHETQWGMAAPFDGFKHHKQIGRESCRERVCQ